MAETFLTSDGVGLAYVRTGRPGERPLILVHGGATDSTCFDPLIPYLAGQHDVLAYDRRGHGASGDVPGPYDVGREVADLAELAAFAAGGGHADVFGYSYGGSIALLLAAGPGASAAIGRLAVYEPPFAVDGLVPAGSRERITDLLAAGDADEALAEFIRLTFGLPDRVIAVMRRRPAWAASLAALPALDRELGVVTSVSPPGRLDPALDVLFLLGDTGGNPGFAAVAAEVTAAARNVTIGRVGGVPHLAIATYTAPLARLLIAHFGRDEPA